MKREIPDTIIYWGDEMRKWNDEAAANNNLPSKTIHTSKMLLGEKANHEFSEELSDGGERDKNIQIFANSPKLKN